LFALTFGDEEKGFIMSWNTRTWGDIRKPSYDNLTFSRQGCLS